MIHDQGLVRVVQRLYLTSMLEARPSLGRNPSSAAIMATSNASDFLAKAISDNKIVRRHMGRRVCVDSDLFLQVTFRLLSRELSIHVNEAKK